VRRTRIFFRRRHRATRTSALTILAPQASRAARCGGLTFKKKGEVTRDVSKVIVKVMKIDS
jgi:hypothetical protein